MIRKRYSPALKAAIVLELLKEDETLTQIASRHGINPKLLRNWKLRALHSLPKLFAHEFRGPRTLESEHQRLVNELYTEIGRLTTQLGWLKKKSGLEPGPR